MPAVGELGQGGWPRESHRVERRLYPAQRRQSRPDAAWISPEQLAAITAEQRKKFLPICPFFLIEVKSPSDTLKKLQDKMDEYIANGCKLGWLIDPEKQQVHIYRPGQPAHVLDQPASVTGDPELPSFVLDLDPVWRP